MWVIDFRVPTFVLLKILKLLDLVMLSQVFVRQNEMGGRGEARGVVVPITKQCL